MLSAILCTDLHKVVEAGKCSYLGEHSGFSEHLAFIKYRGERVGYLAVCKTVYAGSNPVLDSNIDKTSNMPQY